MSKIILDNDLFVSRNLGKLIKKYPRQRVVISQGKVFTGEDAVKKARQRFPKTIPLVMPVPGPEEFGHILGR